MPIFELSNDTRERHDVVSSNGTRIFGQDLAFYLDDPVLKASKMYLLDGDGDCTADSRWMIHCDAVDVLP
jgi:hypothetical protein